MADPTVSADGAQRVLVIAGEVLMGLAVLLVLVWFLRFDTGLDWSSADCAGKPCVFNYHPVLMVLGFGLAGFNGLVSWRTLPASMDRNTRKGIHLGIQTAAFLLAVVGVRAVFKFHNEHSPPIANMYSLHSWLGIAVMVLWALQLSAALYYFVSGVASIEKRQNFMPLHVYFGIAIFVLAMVAMLTGIQEKLGFYQGDMAYAKKTIMSTSGNVLGLILAAVAVIAMLLGVTMTQPNKFDRTAYSQL